MSEIRDSFDRTLNPAALRPRFVDTGRLSITVDTSGYCQARCTSCPWPNMEKRNAVMSLERFNVLLGRVRGFHIEEFGFNIINEPFVDRTISSKISALAESGVLVTMALEPIRSALEHGLVPLVYGDVALDSVTRQGNDL